MTTIRRIYAYLLAFAGLGMLAVAAANLGKLCIDLLLHAPNTGTAELVRETVSINAAAALVGLPVWLLHWRWTERWARDNRQERASTLRRLYLYVVLAAALLVLTYSLQDALSAAIQAFTTPSRVDDALGALPFVAIAALVWVAHWRIAARDRALVGEEGGSATLRRWYLYGAALIGYVTLLSGASLLLEFLWRALTAPGDQLRAADAVASVIVGLGVWLAHWSILPRHIGETAQRDDGVSVLRSVYLFLALSVGVVGALFGLSQLLYYAVARLLGVSSPGGVSGNLLQAAAAPASVAIVYGVAWAYQRHAVRRQAAAFDEAPRQAGVRRLYTYVVALIGLATLAVGAAGLLWTAGDLLVNSAAATSGDGWRGNVALFATLAAVGLPVWLLHWQPVPGADAEVRSLARRLYVYLALIGAMLSLVGSAAAALYRVISLMLGVGVGVGESASVSLLTDLTRALAVAIVAGAVAGYHWRVLRADARRATTEPAPVPAESVAEAQLTVPAESVAEAQLTVQIRAATPADLEHAIAILRSRGVEVAVLPL
ncbi:MAG: hypothetical protein JOZ87_12190 [Chloroflexi bacterium]|nr:hypothetical protein [Chloroflexota bacterium]